MRNGGSAFWRFSLRTYRAPGLAEACLALQDRCGADVNLILFCLWLGRRGRRLGRGEIRRVISLAAPWQSGVVRPLRQARRAISRDDRKLKSLRKRIAAAELHAERIEQSLLARFAAGLKPLPAAPAPQSTRENLRNYFRALGGRITPGRARHLETLAASLAENPPWSCPVSVDG
jgi:uncharacterized protein (TIGR02444 family)